MTDFVTVLYPDLSKLLSKHLVTEKRDFELENFFEILLQCSEKEIITFIIINQCPVFTGFILKI